MALLGFLGKDKKESLKKGLEKTKESVFVKLSRAVAGKSKVDDEVLDNLEEVLVSSDVGVTTTLSIIDRIEKKVAKNKYLNISELNNILKEEIVALLRINNNDTDTEADFSASLPFNPYVIMVVGLTVQEKQQLLPNLLTFTKMQEKKFFWEQLIHFVQQQ